MESSRISNYGWIDAAIRAALDRGAVPFIAVIPVTPVAGPVGAIVGDAAAKEIGKAVRDWQRADEHG